LDDLRQFPFNTPEDIRQNPLRFVCVLQNEIQRIVTLQTSGTTGEPKRIFFTADDQELTIDFFGVGMSALTEPGERVLIFLPGETPGSVGDLLRIGLERKGRKPIPYGMVKDLFHALDVMESQQADFLVGSPTQILSLARRWTLCANKKRRARFCSRRIMSLRRLSTFWKIFGAVKFSITTAQRRWVWAAAWNVKPIAVITCTKRTCSSRLSIPKRANLSLTVNTAKLF